MREDLDKKLVDTFPKIFKNRYASMRITALCWGFPRNGWFPLIWEASKKLEHLANTTHPDLYATQVKEKFATLRFYLSDHSDAVESITNEAAKKSSETCEVCGLKGKQRNNGWFVTRCDKHANGDTDDIHWSVMLKHYLKNWKYYI